ncbi:MAG: adenylyltransferase/cytidyltransferase family protein [Candidatus Delongbacteria bacterium]|jgi:rfaE bifunctional protein nucleotidyltransferase chain/domain|nr:adenylyltransferase/cytidyltransferase family protein [Candidatus Delongbacteria bacterium]MDD4205482.1 adenylyltransferase/cytidyltransferase family protein [Candidatus Delongbacteria bacterium]MDY0017543.1 adenylyltransferase/cytidyltransferase family protein [Candidatus Delongbacteria bacterium]
MTLSIEDLIKEVKNLKDAGKKIVFTNGVFDILHRGHAEYLNKAAHSGDVLIVGINSDLSVKRLKGENRPVNIEDDRAFLVDSLKAVEFTVIFSADTPYELIADIAPDVLIKGGDYDPEETDPDSKKYIVGSDLVKRAGGTVAVIPLVPSRSTTLTLKKIKDLK